MHGIVIYSPIRLKVCSSLFELSVEYSHQHHFNMSAFVDTCLSVCYRYMNQFILHVHVYITHSHPRTMFIASFFFAFSTLHGFDRFRAFTVAYAPVCCETVCPTFVAREMVRLFYISIKWARTVVPKLGLHFMRNSRV